MGYHSTFKVVDTNIPLDVLCERLNAFLDAYNMDCRFETYSDQMVSYDSWRWYDWDTDLAQYAKQYPEDYLIMLRHGEESPDMSRVVVKNGRAVEQYPEVSWPPVDFDPIV